MISVKEAKDIIEQHVSALLPKMCSLNNAASFVLAQDVFAEADVPAFDQSSMDGYAVLFNEFIKTFTVRGEMAAGTNNQFEIAEHEAVRIFTGAPLPNGADTVIMQEKVKADDDKIFTNGSIIKHGDYVRKKGTEIKHGDIALKKNSELIPAAIGFLASVGIAQVEIFPTPVVEIIITGNELQQPGKQLMFGQIYESNSFSLQAALKQAGINNIKITYVMDDSDALQLSLENALQNNDVVLLTGGVSVGSYDFVVQAANACNVIQHFHKIKQRPGKPIYFGSKENKIVFGLPGNPASVLTCFYEYVLPALEKMMQKKNSVKKMYAFLQNNYSKATGLTHFLKSNYTDGKVTILQSQASYQLSSFAEANCFTVIDEEEENVKQNSKVEIHLFP